MSAEVAAARRHRRSRPPDVRARLHRVERRQHQRPARRRPPADDAEERLQGVHDAGHDVHHRSRRAASCGRSRPVVRDADAPRGLPAAAGRAGGGARASADRDRVRRRRHSARSRRARRGVDDARQRADCGVRDAVDEGTAGGGAQVHQGARRHAARQPRRADGRRRICSPRTTRWRRSSTSRKISLVARLLGGEHLLSREEVDRLQGLRGSYGIAAPAPICADPVPRTRRPTARWCRRPSCRTALVPDSEAPGWSAGRAARDRQGRTRKFG